MKFDEDVLLIAGPTASGKTGLSIRSAQENGAAIINTDSMQVYRDLRVITARPSEEEEARAPHHFFGHVDAAVAYSVASWLEDVKAQMAALILQHGKLIFVGGTGLYFNALTDGLSPVPSIDEKIRAKWRSTDHLSAPELHRSLNELDPVAAGQLRASDRQRIMRALEVFESTGRSIFDWQKEKGVPVLPPKASVKKLLLMPDRGVLHERIDMRFDTMVEEGALQEVEALLGRQLDPSLPAMKAIGVPHLGGYLRREEKLEEAIEKTKAASRQYAKRQSTWFRNSFGEGWEVIS